MLQEFYSADGVTPLSVGELQPLPVKFSTVGGGSKPPDQSQSVAMANKFQVIGANATVGAPTTRDLLTGLANGWFDAQGYNSVSVTLITDGTHATGAVTFESTDDTTYTAATAPGLPLDDDNNQLSAPTAAPGALGTNQVRKFSGNLTGRYFRVRLSAAPTAGNIRATASFSQMTWARPKQAMRLTDGSNQMPSADAANRSLYARITDGSNTAAVIATILSLKTDLSSIAGQVVSSILEQGQTAAPLMPGVMLATATTGNLTEVASSARTSSGNSGTITTKVGAAIGAVVNVTASSGTSPTLDVVEEESYDNGTTWRTVRHFVRLTGNGTAVLPPHNSPGRRRWSWVIGGTTPSFTFSIGTTGSNLPCERFRFFFDRTAGLLSGTLNATSATYPCEGCSVLNAKVTLGAATTPGTYQIQVSNDGTGWANVGTATAAVANQTIQLTAIDQASNFFRVICTVVASAQTGTVVSLGAAE